jgi:hypothetical protein
MLDAKTREALRTLAANMAHAARTQQDAYIGGGVFTPEELDLCADALRSLLLMEPP